MIVTMIDCKKAEFKMYAYKEWRHLRLREYALLACLVAGQIAGHNPQ